MFIKILLTVVFLAVLVGVGLYSRKQASSVDGFVLGGSRPRVLTASCLAVVPWAPG